MAYLGRMKAIRKAQKRGRFVGDPGLFSGIGKALKKIQPLKMLGKVAAKVLPVIPGVGQVYNTVKSIETTLFPSTKKFYGPGTMLNSLEQGAGWAKPSMSASPAYSGPMLGPGTEKWTYAPGYEPGGSVGQRLGGTGRRYRRMNPMNPKAANRAIRRIKSVRKILRSIESSLPKQRATATRRK